MKTNRSHEGLTRLSMNQNTTNSQPANAMEANFNVLIMSIGSSAMMSMGLTPDPQSGHVSVDKNLARFNIDLLRMLKDKTKNNLNAEEQNFLDHLLNDLQMKFVQIK